MSALVAIRVEVTAEDIASGRNPLGGRNPYWATPVERALARACAGQGVSVDGDGEQGAIATIGQDEWTLVVELPASVAAWLDERWVNEVEGEPLTFELPVPGWVVALCRPEAPR